MNTKKKNPSSKRAQQGASHAGFHFGHLYQCCQMKFFIRYLLRIDTIKTSPPLITGTAFHEGKAVYYNTKSVKKAVSACRRLIKEHEEEYEYPDRYGFDLERFPLLLEVWIDELGKMDFKTKDLLLVEQEIQVPIPNTKGFIMTMRPDLVYRDKRNNLLYVMDTKTSSSSKKLTDDGLYYGDQATAYLWAVEYLLGEKPHALIGDIAYWNKSAKGPDNISCYRTDLIMRSDQQVREFQQSVACLFNEISQKVTAWKSGKYHKSELFHRNTYYCNSYFHPCEYADICRTDIEEKKRSPIGFFRVPNSSKKNIFSFVKESIPTT